jgi:2-dehydro-3-deoxyphosphogluconate aldolase / (4S)-4-hydroxy-2-oxoglutarate aldolase
VSGRQRLYPWEVMAAVASAGLIAIVRTSDAEAAMTQARRLLAADLQVIEVAFTTSGAAEVVEELALEAGAGTVIGAGTVLDEATARAAIGAGAQFLMAPSLAPAMMATGHRYGVAVIPGAHTPTEVVQAMEHGANAVKLFSASTMGIAGLKAMAEALPQVPWIPTGGIKLEDIGGWLDAGVVAVGIGGSLARSTSEDISRALAQARARRSVV